MRVERFSYDLPAALIGTSAKGSAEHARLMVGEAPHRQRRAASRRHGDFFFSFFFLCFFFFLVSHTTIRRFSAEHIRAGQPAGRGNDTEGHRARILGTERSSGAPKAEVLMNPSRPRFRGRTKHGRGRLVPERGAQMARASKPIASGKTSVTHARSSWSSSRKADDGRSGFGCHAANGADGIDATRSKRSLEFHLPPIHQTRARGRRTKKALPGHLRPRGLAGGSADSRAFI